MMNHASQLLSFLLTGLFLAGNFALAQGEGQVVGEIILTLSAQWSFKPNDVCRSLKESIEHDLFYAEGYLDKTIRRGEYKTYKCRVDRYVYERMYGTPPPPGELDCEKPPDGSEAEGVGTEVGVNPYTCKIEREAPYIENAKEHCTPDEVISGVLAHEKTHVQQCKSNPSRFREEDTEYLGDAEVAAHLVGIEHMLNSLKRVCPGYDTSAYEIRMQAINRARLRP